MTVNAKERNKAGVENTKAKILDRVINKGSLRREYLNILGTPICFAKTCV